MLNMQNKCHTCIHEWHNEYSWWRIRATKKPAVTGFV